MAVFDKLKDQIEDVAKEVKDYAQAGFDRLQKEIEE